MDQINTRILLNEPQSQKSLLLIKKCQISKNKNFSNSGMGWSSTPLYPSLYWNTTKKKMIRKIYHYIPSSLFSSNHPSKKSPCFTIKSKSFVYMKVLAIWTWPLIFTRNKNSFSWKSEFIVREKFEICFCAKYTHQINKSLLMTDMKNYRQCFLCCVS